MSGCSFVCLFVCLLASLFPLGAFACSFAFLLFVLIWGVCAFLVCLLTSLIDCLRVCVFCVECLLLGWFVCVFGDVCLRVRACVFV